MSATHSGSSGTSSRRVVMANTDRANASVKCSQNSGSRCIIPCSKATRRSAHTASAYKDRSLAAESAADAGAAAADTRPAPGAIAEPESPPAADAVAVVVARKSARKSVGSAVAGTRSWSKCSASSVKMSPVCGDGTAASKSSATSCSARSATRRRATRLSDAPVVESSSLSEFLVPSS